MSHATGLIALTQVMGGVICKPCGSDSHMNGTCSHSDALDTANEASAGDRTNSETLEMPVEQTELSNQH